MSEQPNTYEYIVKKQAMLNVDDLNGRIAELESANAFLREKNDSLSYVSTAAAKVRETQNVTDLINFVDVYLLDNGLSLDFTGNSDSGILFYIENAQVNDENIITPNKTNYTVSGTVSFEWVVEVDAADEDEAQEIAEGFISSTSYSFHTSKEPDVITASSIDDYYPNIEVVDVYEN